MILAMRVSLVCSTVSGSESESESGSHWLAVICSPLRLFIYSHFHKSHSSQCQRLKFWQARRLTSLTKCLDLKSNVILRLPAAANQSFSIRLFVSMCLIIWVTILALAFHLSLVYTISCVSKWNFYSSYGHNFKSLTSITLTESAYSSSLIDVPWVDLYYKFNYLGVWYSKFKWEI